MFLPKMPQNAFHEIKLGGSWNTKEILPGLPAYF